MPSGAFAVVNEIPSIVDWNVSESANVDAYVSSGTGGATARGRSGIHQWEGSISGKGKFAPVFPNQYFDFKGYITPANGVEGEDGPTYEGNAIVESVSLSINWAANQIYTWSVSFRGNGVLTYQAAEPPYIDVTAPSTATPCGTVINYRAGASGTLIPIPAIVSANLQITAAIAQEVNSSTYDVTTAKCWTKHSPGSIDWSLGLAQQDYKRGVSGYPDLGTDLEIQIGMGDSEALILRFAKQLAYSNLTVQRQGNAIVARQINLAMQAYAYGTLGQIILPGETDPIWGLEES